MRFALAAYVVFIAALSGTVLYAGPVRHIFFSHDFFGLAEGGWKIVQGDVPYLDFSTQMGPLTHLILAAGILVTGPKADAFPMATVLSLIPVAGLAWWVFSRRMGPLLCLLASVYVAAVWVAPFPLHFDFDITAYAMNYNRQSYVILSLFMTVLIADLRSDYFLAGFLFALLAFFKFPFFFAGGLLLLFYLVDARPPWRGLGWMAAGFLVVALPITAWLRGMSGLVAMAEEIYRTSELHTALTVTRGLKLVRSEMPVPLIQLIISVFSLAYLSRRWPCRGLTPSAWLPLSVKLWTEAVIVLVVAFMAEMGGSPLGSLFDVPLLGVYSLVLTHRLMGFAQRELPLAATLLCALGVLCCVGLVLPLAERSLEGVAHTAWEKAHPRNYGWSTLIDGPGVRNIRFFDDGMTAEVTYAGKINDGLNLIRRHPELDHALIATLDFTDAFSFSMQRKSPPHMPLGLQYGYDMNETIYPDPGFIFAGCEGLMIPKHPETDVSTIAILLVKYHDYLAAHFVKLDESSQWTLYRRK